MLPDDSLTDDYDKKIKRLNKEVRILKQQLERSVESQAKLEDRNRNKESVLRRVISELEEYQNTLETKSSDLERAFHELTVMQDKLVEVETMAALGSLVAGVAHEINTPVGTSITLASTLFDETKRLLDAIASGKLKRSHLTDYLEIAADSTQLILSNLMRAGELVQSFKQVAVDQSSLEQRHFKVKPYLEEVIVSLSPQFKKTQHTISVRGDDAIEIYSYPGALAQVATNLVANSLTHAYLHQSDRKGQLYFNVSEQGDRILIEYCDDGCGMPQEVLSKIFEPFFTTARNTGGTGLGLHITYNLVSQKLKGQIDVQSAVGKGTQFMIAIPASAKS